MVATTNIERFMAVFRICLIIGWRWSAQGQP
jgi:hypothetical protein